MSRSMRLRRATVPLIAGLLLALTGCGSDEPPADSGSSGENGGAASADKVSAAGVAFQAPEGWESLDPNDADLPAKQQAELAKGLGLTPEQFQQTISGVDLFLVDGEGPQDGFLSNINVLAQPGALPDDAMLESQFAAIGAKVLEVSHTETGAGDAAVVAYSLSVADRTIEGVSYLVDLGEEIVTVTVSTPDRGQSDKIGATIGDTLDKAA
jgi:hypothetical protein